MNTYSEKITSEKAESIKNILLEKHAVFDKVQYSVWRAKTKDFQAIYYNSGKILIQGKEVSDIVSQLFGKTTINNKPVLVQDCLTNIGEDKVYIGTDESGKGDFFGALVIAGVQVNETNSQKFINAGIKDSKKLDDKKILQLANLIKANSVHSVVVITPQKYNELYYKFNNLNKLLAWGHARAIENILEKSPCSYALADKFGDESLIQNSLMTKGKNITLYQRVRAESDIAVAAASVLARSEFVKKIAEMENKYSLTFSKGVSQKVIEQANIFIEKYSFQRLNEVAKLHFKTLSQLNKY